MNKWTLFGILSWLVSFCVYGYQGLKGLMDKDNVWGNITIWDITGDFIVDFSDHIPFGSLQRGYEYVVMDLPLYQFMLAMGLVLLIVGSFSRK